VTGDSAVKLESIHWVSIENLLGGRGSGSFTASVKLDILA